MLFTDRADAGRQLARRLRHLRGHDVVVLGLPRGGVPVAFEVAVSLKAPLDTIVVRKLGVPSAPEFGFGAIGEDGVRFVDADTVRLTGLTEEAIAAVEAAERAEIARQVRRLHGDRPPAALAGRTVVIVDDGLATGSTARAACRVARARGAGRIVVAVPVGSAAAVASVRQDADEVVCAHVPRAFLAIGQYYADFTQTADAEVRALLDKTAAAAVAAAAAAASGPPREPAEVVIDAGPARLRGILAVPPGAAGIVLFAHGSGSGRNSPRNQSVAAALNRAGLGTLLADLLADGEERDRDRVFDIPLLAGRLTAITGWVRREPAAARLPVGYFGASTGAAAALRAAADPRLGIMAIVSRGGRPDLAGDALAAVRAPTLLIVGGADDVVLDLNRRAQEQLTCENRLTVIPGATHLFTEPGALDQVAGLAAEWFTRHLGRPGQRT
jgi:putative phosphoribosyl transferase